MVDGEYILLEFNKIGGLIILSLGRIYMQPTLAQLVERRTVVGVSLSDILRSLVRIRQVG